MKATVLCPTDSLVVVMKSASAYLDNTDLELQNLGVEILYIDAGIMRATRIVAAGYESHLVNMKILLHSSKTMKPDFSSVHELTTPRFIKQAAYIIEVLQNIDTDRLAALMGINDVLADSVKERIDEWNDGSEGAPAALTFRGDIYSGLSASGWSKDDAAFAQKNLLILSGLYGLLRPFDAIKPYRLEMGYKLKLEDGLSLDKFWERQLADALNPEDSYINLTAVEYFKTIRGQLSSSVVISPKFLTVSEKTGTPVFVTVHAKIARGSFANWLVKNRVSDLGKIPDYDWLNYKYDKTLSTQTEPVFVCRRFGGLGLSVRLK